MLQGGGINTKSQKWNKNENLPVNFLRLILQAWILFAVSSTGGGGWVVNMLSSLWPRTASEPPAWDGVAATIASAAYVAEFQKWYERCRKYIETESSYMLIKQVGA